MYDLRSRPGIHQAQQVSGIDSERTTTKLRSPKSFSQKHHNDKELESDGSDEDSLEQEKPRERLYPKLPMEDVAELKEERSKMKTQVAEAKYPKLQQESNPWGVTNVLILVLIPLVILIIYCLMRPADNITTCGTPVCLFQNQYKSLRDTFLSQEKLSWKIIKSAITSVVNQTEHTQPAVIFLIANKNAKIILSCIANSLATSVALSYGNSPDYPKIQNKKLFNSKKMTEIIYSTFKESFGKENHHVIVLENLDTFPADTAMALHFFCDHENAPYKNIVIILTAVAEDFPVDKKLRLRDIDSIARNHLDQVWKNELVDEKRAALLSRITGSVAIIHTEKNIPSICLN